jgi:hypothetical protein
LQNIEIQTIKKLLAFLCGSQENTAVAFSLIFFLISAFVSLGGAFVKVDLKNQSAQKSYGG